MAGAVYAEDHYVRDGAPSGGDGSDWDNAFDELPPDLTRGDTYLVATGDYSGYTFDDAESDTSTITIRRATAAAHGTDMGWDASYADGVAHFGNLSFETGYYVVDGAVGGGPGSWTTGFGIEIDGGWHTIHLANGASHIELRHLDIENNGRYTADNNEHLIYSIEGSEDVTISNCYLHDVCTCHVLTRGSRGFTIEYSMLARNGPSGFDDIHREAWSGSDDDDVIIRFSIFEDISNTAIIGLVNGNGDAENWQIYGNVFRNSGDLDDVAISGSLVVKNDEPTLLRAVNWRVHNNSFYNLAGLSAGLRLGDGTGNEVYNNIWYQNVVNIIDFWHTDHDHNWYYDNIRTDGCDPPCELDEDNVAGETNAELGIADPFVDSEHGDFHLAAPTAAGRTLEAPYDVDMEGNTRGLDGVWDRGAMEYVPPPGPCAEQGGSCCDDGQLCDGGSMSASTDCGSLCCVGGTCTDGGDGDGDGDSDGDGDGDSDGDGDNDGDGDGDSDGDGDGDGDSDGGPDDASEEGCSCAAADSALGSSMLVVLAALTFITRRGHSTI